VHSGEAAEIFVGARLVRFDSIAVRVHPAELPDRKHRSPAQNAGQLRVAGMGIAIPLGHVGRYWRRKGAYELGWP